MIDPIVTEVNEESFKPLKVELVLETKGELAYFLAAMNLSAHSICEQGGYIREEQMDKTVKFFKLWRVLDTHYCLPEEYHD